MRVSQFGGGIPKHRPTQVNAITQEEYSRRRKAADQVIYRGKGSTYLPATQPNFDDLRGGNSDSKAIALRPQAAINVSNPKVMSSNDPMRIKERRQQGAREVLEFIDKFGGAVPQKQLLDIAKANLVGHKKLMRCVKELQRTRKITRHRDIDGVTYAIAKLKRRK